METKNTKMKSPLAQLKASKRGMKICSVVLTVLVLNLFTGCSYYKVKGVPDADQNVYLSRIKEFNEADKYIVLHQNAASLHLQDASLDENGYLLKGTPSTLPPTHSYEKYPEIGKSYRYKKDRQSPLNEVHLYLDQTVNLGLGEKVSIPISAIQSMGYNENNRNKSAGNVFLGVIGTLAGLLIIVALTKSSCPFIYANNGEAFVFQGEMYPGNIIENAQQPNFIKLPDLHPIKGEYALQITNELLEIQHTDEASLIVVDHPESVSVFMDPKGNIQTISNPIPPTRALADGYRDIAASLSEKDGKAALFETPKQQSDGTRHLDLSFDHKATQNTAKLLLSLKNSLWLDYALGKFYEQFGDYYPEFQETQQGVSLDEAKRWRSNQSLPLSVYIDRGNGWELQQEIPAVGPLQYQDIAVPLELSGLGDAPLKVRLQTGFMFWDIDQAVIDYSKNSPLAISEIKPSAARDNHGQDAVTELSASDQNYLTQSEVGDWVEVRYQSPSIQGESRTVFLKNKGFYTYKRNYQGTPDFGELKKFRNPGHFTAFAEEQYNRIILSILEKKPKVVQRHETP